MKRTVTLLGCAVVVLIAAMAGSAGAADWTLTTITDNSYNDTEPRLSGSHVVWQGHVGDNYPEVMLYDIETGITKQLTDNAWEDSDPHVSATHVVWQEYPESGGNILVYDIDANETLKVSDDAYYNNMPRISGSHVVWQGKKDDVYDLFVYRLDTGELTRLDLNSLGDLFPQISGSIVVYQTGALGTTSVHLYDASAEDGPVSLAAGAKYPEVSDTHAIWKGLGGTEIFLCEIADGTPGDVQQLTANAASDAAPQVTRSHVVWESAAYEIILYDIPSGTTTQITNNDGMDSGPKISKSVLAWRWRSKPPSPYEYAVYVYDLTDPEAVPEPLVADNAFPEVHGWNVVWQSPGPSGSEIVLARPVSINQPPVADAGQDQVVLVGETVVLDGSGSYDGNYDPLTFRWSLTTRPQGSTAELSDPEEIETTFLADAPGTYLVSLVVNDGFKDSSSDNVTVEAITVLDAVTQELLVAVEEINGLDPSAFKNRKMAKTLVKKINAALKKVEKGDYDKAIKKLEKDVLRKMDGCANSSAPDKNDWLRTAEAQDAVYPSVALAIELLGDLVP